MTPRLSHILLAAGLVIGLLGFVAMSVDSCRRKAVSVAENQANTSHGEATAHAQAAQTSDAKVADIQGELVHAKADVARLTREVAVLRGKVAPRQVIPDPVGPAADPAPPAPADDRDSLIAKQDETIQALVHEVEVQGIQLDTLATSRDEWKRAFEAEQRRAVGLQIALDTQKHVAGSSKWVGRIQGFAIGIGTGYVAGRLK